MSNIKDYEELQQIRSSYEQMFRLLDKKIEGIEVKTDKSIKIRKLEELKGILSVIFPIIMETAKIPVDPKILELLALLKWYYERKESELNMED